MLDPMLATVAHHFPRGLLEDGAAALPTVGIAEELRTMLESTSRTLTIGSLRAGKFSDTVRYAVVSPGAIIGGHERSTAHAAQSAHSSDRPRRIDGGVDAQSRYPADGPISTRR
jgi:hypothetical protein